MYQAHSKIPTVDVQMLSESVNSRVELTMYKDGFILKDSTA